MKRDDRVFELAKNDWLHVCVINFEHICIIPCEGNQGIKNLF